MRIEEKERETKRGLQNGSETKVSIFTVRSVLLALLNEMERKILHRKLLLLNIFLLYPINKTI